MADHTMVSENNYRIYVTVSKEMLAKLDATAKLMGITRSALCAYLMGQGMLGLEKAQNMADLVTQAVKELVEKETSKAIAENAG